MKAALTVEENLDFWSRYLAQSPDLRSRTVEAALEVVGLSHIAGAPFGVLSAGQKRRAALARLLVAFRPLWLLDEPLTALDRASREKFAAAMREHCAQGGLIVAATHEPLGLDEAKEIGPRERGIMLRCSPRLLALAPHLTSPRQRGEGSSAPRLPPPLPARAGRGEVRGRGIGSNAVRAWSLD